jgi:succinate dehydrogenase / fumarate reductase flavoprotein subunit
MRRACHAAHHAEARRRVPLQGHAGRRRDAYHEIAEQVAQTQIKDKSKVFNTARIEALELDNLIEVAKATIVSANARTESRGAHVRDDAVDTPETPDGRDDKNWLKHTLWYRDGNRLDYKPVQMKPMSVDTIELKKRAY